MKLIYLAILSLSLAALCFGQQKENDDKPDLSGTWQLMESKNTMRSGNFKQFWTISQHDAEFKISVRTVKEDKETTVENIYFTDERGERILTALTVKIFQAKRSGTEKR